MAKKSPRRIAGHKSRRLILSRVRSTIAIDRIDAGTLDGALTQILLVSGTLAQAHKIQFQLPFSIRVIDKSGTCFVSMAAAFDEGAWKQRVLQVNLPKLGVRLPVYVLLQDQAGKRVKALVQSRSRKTVPKECW